MLRPKKKKAEMAISRRRELIDATMAVIAVEGYAGASVERITSQAGVSRGLIRHYFTSKGELLAEAYRHIGEQLVLELRRVSGERDTDPLSQFAALIDVIFDPPIFQLDVLSAWYALRDAARTDPLLRGANREIYRWYRQHIHELFESASPKLTPKSQVDRMADGFVALTDGLWLELTIEPYAFRARYAKQICSDYVSGALRLEPGTFLVGAEKEEEGGSAKPDRAPARAPR